MLECGMFLRRLIFLLYASGVALVVCASAQQSADLANLPAPISVYFSASTARDEQFSLDPTTLRVVIDGQQVAVTDVHSANKDPLLFALLIDTNISMSRQLDSIKRAAIELFNQLSARGGQGYIGFFDVSTGLSKPGTPADAATLINSAQLRGSKAIYDIIGRVCNGELNRRRNAQFPRRAIFLITDGEDTQSRMYGRQALEAAQREGVTIYSLSLGLRGSGGDDFLKDAAKKTGGASVSGMAVDLEVNPILADLNRQWLVTFQPAGTPDDKMHAIHIDSPGSGISFSAPLKILLK